MPHLLVRGTEQTAQLLEPAVRRRLHRALGTSSICRGLRQPRSRRRSAAPAPRAADRVSPSSAWVSASRSSRSLAERTWPHSAVSLRCQTPPGDGRCWRRQWSRQTLIECLAAVGLGGVPCLSASDGKRAASCPAPRPRRGRCRAAAGTRPAAASAGAPSRTAETRRRVGAAYPQIPSSERITATNCLTPARRTRFQIATQLVGPTCRSSTAPAAARGSAAANACGPQRRPHARWRARASRRRS